MQQLNWSFESWHRLKHKNSLQANLKYFWSYRKQSQIIAFERINCESITNFPANLNIKPKKVITYSKELWIKDIYEPQKLENIEWKVAR